jgi:ribosomal protein S18 acetylase RimI-like enzyme
MTRVEIRQARGNDVRGAAALAWLAVTPRVPLPSTVQRVFGDIQSVYVTPSQRKLHLGTRLIETVKQHAVARGLDRLTVHSMPDSVAFYQQLGFASTAQLSEYFVRAGIDIQAGPHGQGTPHT